jgi:hypothetical protein
MPTLETLTEAELRQWLAKSVNKGYRYVNRVKNPTRAGQTLSAEVQGGWLYQVEVTLSDAGLSSHCGCSWGGDCKHVAAVLLKWIQSPNSFAVGEAPVVLRDHALEVVPVEPPKTHRPQDLPGWITASFEERRQAESRQLKQWLAEVTLPSLRSTAKQRGWQIKGNNKQAVVEQIAEQIVNPEDILAAVQKLDAEHLGVLKAMVVLGHGIGVKPQDVERVARFWGELTSHKQITVYTGRLRDEGLAVFGRAFAYQSAPQDLTPDVIARHLVPVVLDMLTRHPSPRDTVLPQLADPYPLVRAVNQIALLLEQSPVALRTPMPRPQIEKFYPALQHWDYDPAEIAAAQQNGQLQRHGYTSVNLTVPPPRYSLPDDAVERLSPLAGGEARLEFIYALLVSVGLFQPGSPVTVWQEVKERFLRLDEMAQRAVLARAYFGMTNWSELWDVLRMGQVQLKRAGGYSHYEPESLRADLGRLRAAVLRALACLPDDQWIALDELYRLMRVIMPRFDQGICAYYGPANSSGAWFLTKTGGETPLDMQDERNWDMAQGSFIRRIITGLLHWLGLADLGKKDDDQVVAFRLHGLGDLYWDRVQAPPALHPVAAQTSVKQDPGKAIATEGARITVNPSAIKSQAHSLLERIARLDVAAAERFVYRLDAQVVYRSFEAGVSLSDLIRDWERLLPVSMPKDIRAQLTQWWEAYGRVRIYENLAVIELGDEYALAEIKAATSLEQHLIAEISPRLVIVDKEAVPALTAELEKAGYTPKQTSEV